MEQHWFVNNAPVCTSPGYHPRYFSVRKACGYHSAGENAAQAFLNLPFGNSPEPCSSWGDRERDGRRGGKQSSRWGRPFKEAKGTARQTAPRVSAGGERGHRKERRNVSLDSADGPLRRNLQLISGSLLSYLHEWSLISWNRALD